MEIVCGIPDKQNKKRIVIAGGGFAGLKIARKLDPRRFQIVLLDRNNYHLFQPLLYQVATSGIEPSAISFPFRRIFKNYRDFYIRLCRVERVMAEEKVVVTSIGTIAYDYLVIATGCDTNFFGNTTLPQQTMQLKTTSEALYNRNRIIASFEEALNCPAEEVRRRKMTFVIVGGGATGIEMAGALAEMRKFILPKDYPDLDIGLMQIILIDAGARLLSAFSEKSSAEVEKHLADLKVEIRLNCSVTGYDGNRLVLNDGFGIETENVFWVAGVKANSLTGFTADRYGRGNRLLVDAYNRVCGLENVFAIGDTALMVTAAYPNGHPQVVQPAIQQARLLAKNLEKMETGKALKPFVYYNKGSMATIGRNKAIVEMKGMRLSGFIAWAIWLFIHLMSIVGVKNRLFIFVDWMWSYVTYDQSLRILIKPRKDND